MLHNVKWNGFSRIQHNKTELFFTVMDKMHKSAFPRAVHSNINCFLIWPNDANAINCSPLNVVKTNKQPAEKWYKTQNTTLLHFSSNSLLNRFSIKATISKKNGFLKNTKTIFDHFWCLAYPRAPCAKSFQFTKESVAVQLNAHRIHLTVLGIVYFIGAVFSILEGENIRGILRGSTILGHRNHTHCILFDVTVTKDRIGHIVQWLGRNHWNEYEFHLFISCIIFDNFNLY